METTLNNNFPGNKKTGYGKWVAGAVVGALLIANGVLFHRVSTLETDLSKQRAAAQKQFADFQEASASATAALNEAVQEINAQFQEGTKAANANAQRMAAQAASNAQKNTEKIIAQLKEQQAAREEEFEQEIGAVRSVTDEHAAKVSGLESSVGNVKETVGTVQQEVAKNKTTLDQTIAELKSARGDLGVQSGLIATNAKELAALRELGEKTYYEFTLAKNKPARVGNMQLELKKADTKRNKYNMNVVADDKKIEKKDKTVNEPVQLYVSGSRIPYEIVVNEVKKDVIVGYVAVPKATLRAAR